MHDTSKFVVVVLDVDMAFNLDDDEETEVAMWLKRQTRSFSFRGISTPEIEEYRQSCAAHHNGK